MCDALCALCLSNHAKEAALFSGTRTPGSIFLLGNGGPVPSSYRIVVMHIITITQHRPPSGSHTAAPIPSQRLAAARTRARGAASHSLHKNLMMMTMIRLYYVPRRLASPRSPTVRVNLCRGLSVCETNHVYSIGDRPGRHGPTTRCHCYHHATGAHTGAVHAPSPLVTAPRIRCPSRKIVTFSITLITACVGVIRV